jgi:hypothetical protein
VNFEEGKILNAGLRITHGLTPYPPLSHPPYFMNVYGPVFYYVMAPLVKWFGLSFTAPRILVLASGLTVAVLLVLLLRHWTKSWVIALGFGLSFLAASLVRDWVHVLRVNLFGAVLALTGLYVFTKTRSLIWPALLFLAALFTEITFLAAPVACICYLLLAGERRRAYRFTGWMLLFGVGGLMSLGLGTHGWALFDMFLTHPDTYSLGIYFSRIGPFVALNTGLVVGAFALALTDFRRRSFSLPLLYCAFASLMTLTAGKIAADGNHLLEWQAAMCLGAGCGYGALRKRWGFEPALALIPLAVVSLALLGLSEGRQVNPALAGCPAAYQFAAEQPGELLAENSGLAAVSGKRMWLNDFFEYSILGTAGRLDQQPLIQMVQQRFFGVIVLGDDLPTLQRSVTTPNPPWPPQFISALAANYHQVAQFACAGANFAFEPNHSASSPPPPTH